MGQNVCRISSSSSSLRIILLAKAESVFLFLFSFSKLCFLPTDATLSTPMNEVKKIEPKIAMTTSLADSMTREAHEVI